MSGHTTIDLVTYDPKRDAHVLVAVEQGPWPSGKNTECLRRLQAKLYNYVEVAIDGLLAIKYPESRGKSIVIRLDCYGTPQAEVEQFFFRLADHIHASTQIQDAVALQGNISEIGFEFSWKPLG